MKENKMEIQKNYEKIDEYVIPEDVQGTSSRVGYARPMNEEKEIEIVNEIDVANSFTPGSGGGGNGTKPGTGGAKPPSDRPSYTEEETTEDVTSEEETTEEPTPEETTEEETETETETETEEETTEDVTSEEETETEEEGNTIIIETHTEVPFLEKPINEYSTNEGLLLLILILGIVSFVYSILQN